MSEYTPSTEELRNAYRFHGRAVDDSRYKARGKPLMTDAEYDLEFDRWLDRVKAEARRDALLAEAEALEHYEHIWAPDGGVYLGHITGLIRRDADRIEKGESNE